MISEVDHRELDELRSGGKDFILHIEAEWCHPCKLMERYLVPMSDENPGITFAKIDYDRYPDIFEELEIGTVPYTVFFRKGKIERKIRGYVSSEKFSGLLADFLSEDRASRTE